MNGSIILILGILFLASASFGQDSDSSDYMDNYTGANADKVGTSVCLTCHADRGSGDGDSHVSFFEGTEEEPGMFRGMGCESCHGPGGNHYGKPEGILNFNKMPAEEVTTRCSMCHQEKGIFKLDEWNDGKHINGGLSCVTCHSGHSENDKHLREATVVELCTSCHTDIGEAYEAGEHGMMGEDQPKCSTCHNPHD